MRNREKILNFILSKPILKSIIIFNFSSNYANVTSCYFGINNLVLLFIMDCETISLMRGPFSNFIIKRN
jgi:hypothetical protein